MTAQATSIDQPLSNSKMEAMNGMKTIDESVAARPIRSFTYEASERMLSRANATSASLN